MAVRVFAGPQRDDVFGGSDQGEEVLRGHVPSRAQVSSSGSSVVSFFESTGKAVMRTSSCHERTTPGLSVIDIEPLAFSHAEQLDVASLRQTRNEKPGQASAEVHGDKVQADQRKP